MIEEKTQKEENFKNTNKLLQLLSCLNDNADFKILVEESSKQTQLFLNQLIKVTQDENDQKISKSPSIFQRKETVNNN